MSKKELTREKIEGLEDIAHIYGAEGVSLQKYFSRSNIKRLEENLGEEVRVMGVIFFASKTKRSVFLFVHPEKKDKCLLIAPSEKTAKKFYDALSALEKKEGEQCQHIPKNN